MYSLILLFLYHMSRHSKNNTAHSIFTQGEKQMVTEWGTKKQRLGAESFKEFNACCLCLKAATQPVSCSSGHIFCKECIFSNIISQKELYKEKKNLWKLDQAKQWKSLKEKESLSLEKQKEKFLAAENGQNSSENWKKFDESRKYEFLSEEKRTHAQAKDFLQSKDKKQFSKQELIQQSFWVPELTPETSKTIEKKPSKWIKCPEGQHKLSKKHLISLKVETDSLTKKFLCGGCLGPFTFQSGVLLKCGHVFCCNCLTAKTCLKCGVEFTEKNKIKLSKGGTMFAAHNQVEAKIIRPAFQC